MADVLVCRWILPEPALETTWIGPDQRLLSGLSVNWFGVDPYLSPAKIRRQAAAIPTAIGPRGRAGDGGSGAQRYDVSLAGTWIINHDLGRIPIVHVYIGSGELVIADVTASDTQITVVFGSPQQGFVMAV